MPAGMFAATAAQAIALLALSAIDLALGALILAGAVASVSSGGTFAQR